MNNLPTQYGAQRNVPPGAMDVWNQGQMPTQLGMPAPQQAAPAGPSPVAVVQRLLRGRIALAIVLAFIGAIIGAGLGYMSQANSYKALGQIRIKPVIALVEGDKAYPYYAQMMTSEALTIGSPAVIGEVPKTEPWKSVVGKNQEALGDLGANLKATYIKQSVLINLEYANQDPKIASAGVQTVINVYAKQFRSDNASGIGKKLEELTKRKEATESEIDLANNKIIEVTKTYGLTDLQGLASAAQNKVELVERDLRGYKSNLKNANDAIKAQRDSSGKLAISELAAIDPILNNMIRDQQVAQLNMQLDSANLGPNHKKVRDAKVQLDIRQAAIEAYAESLRKEVLAIIPDMVKGGGEKVRITTADLRLLETRVSTLEDELNEAKKGRDQINNDAAKVAEQQIIMKKKQQELEGQTDKLTSMQYQAAATGTLDVVQDGSFAGKDKDKKILFGLAGAMVGACLPVGLLMLMGLMDTRFRYSDDAAGQSMAGIPLLGILPNLPDRLSDPAQASIAAHCVHQIRTMLQLNAMRDGSTAFAITSASSGDGKTSLSLALGLSFAASGSRTLLIDADLVGGGLTSRLGNETSIGIVDALAGVGLEDCVQPTDVADLSLLPIGNAQAHHAGSFSPPAVRKLLAEIRKHYEVIVIDTGPVMGSIEATPICASVDGVVLTVARGQSRPLVERAITHLSSIGAKVAGVVFNRAQHKDFEQSIGAISVRSAARSTMNGTGHNSRKNGDMGAVASAVAGNVNRNEN